jgi:hypothetical protein
MGVLALEASTLGAARCAYISATTLFVTRDKSNDVHFEDLSLRMLWD